MYFDRFSTLKSDNSPLGIVLDQKLINLVLFYYLLVLTTFDKQETRNSIGTLWNDLLRSHDSFPKSQHFDILCDVSCGRYKWLSSKLDLTQFWKKEVLFLRPFLSPPETPNVDTCLMFVSWALQNAIAYVCTDTQNFKRILFS